MSYSSKSMDDSNNGASYIHLAENLKCRMSRSSWKIVETILWKSYALAKMARDCYRVSHSTMLCSEGTILCCLLDKQFHCWLLEIHEWLWLGNFGHVIHGELKAEGGQSLPKHITNRSIFVTWHNLEHGKGLTILLSHDCHIMWQSCDMPPEWHKYACTSTCMSHDLTTVIWLSSSQTTSSHNFIIGAEDLLCL